MSLRVSRSIRQLWRYPSGSHSKAWGSDSSTPQLKAAFLFGHSADQRSGQIQLASRGRNEAMTTSGRSSWGVYWKEGADQRVYMSSSHQRVLGDSQMQKPELELTCAHQRQIEQYTATEIF